MKPTRLVPRVIGHTLFAAALVCCAGSQQQSPGVTNAQPLVSPPEGKCLSRGTQCLADNDCCTQWCANGHCTRREP